VIFVNAPRDRRLPDDTGYEGDHPMTSTRIRDIRKRRGLTLQELAERVGTTAQTIQRLETDNMSVSSEWLQRIGEALGLTPGDLMAGDRVATLQHLGDVVADGSVRTAPGKVDRTLPLKLPQGERIAVRMISTVGPYPVGTILLAERLDGSAEARVSGRDCIVALEDNRIILRRVVRSRGGDLTLHAISGSDNGHPAQPISWIAPVVMSISYHD